MPEPHRSLARRLGGAFAAAVFASLLLAGCGGHPGGPGDGGTGDGGAAPPPLDTIAGVDAAAVAEPYLAGNTVQHYCDCQAGAAAGCLAGDDTAGDGTEAHPYQTLDAAMQWVNGAAGRTAALCRGGSFVPASAGQFVYTLAVTGCPVGKLCNEVREYPVGGSDPRPLITNPAGNHYLFTSAGYNQDTGGWRFMNLRLKGSWDPTKKGNLAFFLYASLGHHTHDLTIENVDMDGFDLAIQDANNANDAFTIRGNHITHAGRWAFLGGSSDLDLSYNSFVDDGSDNKFDHAVYLASHAPVSNVTFEGNYVTGFSTQSGNTNCQGAPINGHGAFDTLLVRGNVMVEDATADPGCWGLAFTNITGAKEPIFLRHATFDGNVVVNGGNTSLLVDNCPDCLIENNLVIQTANFGGYGLVSPGQPARTLAQLEALGCTDCTTGDDVETGATLVNNTIYFGAGSANGMNAGLGIIAEGQGYVAANNVVTYVATSHGKNAVSCFAYPLSTSAYQFIDHNLCHVADTQARWQSSGFQSLSDWQSASGFDAHSSQADPAWPFTAPLTIPAWDDAKTAAELFARFFTPSGPPLSGAGDASHAAATDITGATRPAPPSIGAYEP